MWLDWIEDIQKIVVNHFQNLYNKQSQSNSVSINLPNLNILTLLNNHQQWLCKPFFIKEIWDAIKLMPPDKVCNPNGFLVRFYQHSWSLIGKAIT